MSEGYEVPTELPGSTGSTHGFGLKGAEKTIIDIFNIIQKVSDTGIHLKDLLSRPRTEEQRRRPQKRSVRQMGRERTYTTCHKVTTRLLHNTKYKSANKSLAKA